MSTCGIIDIYCHHVHLLIVQRMKVTGSSFLLNVFSRGGLVSAALVGLSRSFGAFVPAYSNS